MEAMKTPKVLSASTLVGDKVTNVNGEDLGTVEEIMLDRPCTRANCLCGTVVRPRKLDA